MPRIACRGEGAYPHIQTKRYYRGLEERKTWIKVCRDLQQVELGKMARALRIEGKLLI